MKSSIILAAMRGLLLLAVAAFFTLHADRDLAHAQGIDKTYEENSAAPVAAFEASDEEGTVVAWFLTGIDGGDFEVDNGTLNFRRPPDYEAPSDADGDNVYEVSVNVTDGTNTSTAALTVTVTNAEESGTVYLSSLQPEVDIPLTASLTDPDIGVTDVTWAWEISTDATSWSSISEATSNSYTPLAADVGKYLRVTASYTDAEGPGKQAQEVSYFVVREPYPAGHAPEFPGDEDGARSVAENTAPGTPLGAPLAAVDEEGHVLTYTLSGADATYFDVDRSSGQLLTKAWLDYEARAGYSMDLTVSDPTNASDSITVTISVTNLEEEGTITLSTPQPITGSEVVAYLDDPDGSVTGVSWQWEASQDGADWGLIAGAESSSYTPTTATAGNYLRVTASYTDGEGPDKGAQAVSFNPVKAAVDHAPVFPSTETGLRSVAENTPRGTPIGEPFTAADADGHALTYFLLDELDADSFDIDSSSGQLLTRAPLDYETRSLYRLTVAVHDGGDAHEADDHSFDATLAVTVIVTDVDEDAVDDCIQPMPDSGTVTGTWDANCLSENRPDAEDGSAGSDYYARYYTFTLPDAASVTITLTSDHDTYLYLMSGTGAGGDVVESNDDIETHTDRNSRLEIDALDSGEYTIEATTYDVQRTGDFTLTLTLDVVEVEEPPGPIVEYTEISSGANHVCALTTEGGVMCWGADDFGQVSGHPTAGRFVQISSGDNHSCALRDDGAVICWGSITVP